MTTKSKEKPVTERTSGTSSKVGKAASVLESHGFKLGKTLGHGSYANVMWAHSAKHKIKVAVKIVSKKKAPEDYLVKFLPREIDVIKNLKHPNLICFLQSIETTSRVYLIMEMAENGDLLDYIKSHGAVSETQAAIWFHQLCMGIDYCHHRGVVHRDLKCENLLLNKNNNLKITDFGFARGSMKPKDGRRILSETYCGSYAYAPPEILRGMPYDPHFSDIWSMGVILFTMLFGQLPFDDSNHKTLMQQVQCRVKFPANKTVSEDCKDLICRMLSPVKERITLKEIKHDPWTVRMAPYYPKPKTKAAAASQEAASTSTVDGDVPSVQQMNKQKSKSTGGK
ncbi:testis-specific serine/threonine-protein kinase 4-like [Saccoglossus kowalevskii]|uniref:Testis-specific serine/threonine-protein kinase 4-like n=1 Tax=Saccoglossus kowalevskii TaxID=10224 RepID=A0ABM0H1X6_SACKO|nr:PREDICTED: testis-specific serine/threonine-protein kinase 4-like [Saccoglossus kowalevskii]